MSSNSYEINLSSLNGTNQLTINEAVSINSNASFSNIIFDSLNLTNSGTINNSSISIFNNFLLSSGYLSQNTVCTSSMTVNTFSDSNLDIYQSNLLTYESNLLTFESNLSIYESNVSEAIILATWCSNEFAVLYSANTTDLPGLWSSNQIPIIDNEFMTLSNELYWLSNQIPLSGTTDQAGIWSSNQIPIIDNDLMSLSNEVFWLSNQIPLTGNTDAIWSSNQIQLIDNEFMTLSNDASWSSNEIILMSNDLMTLSNSLEFVSKSSTWSSNSLFWDVMPYINPWASNQIANIETAITVSNGIASISGVLGLSNQTYIDFGYGIPKESNAGKVGYQLFTPGLDIVGAGDVLNLRLVSIFDDLNVAQNISCASTLYASNIIVNTNLSSPYTLNVNGNINCATGVFVNGVELTQGMTSLPANISCTTLAATSSISCSSLNVTNSIGCDTLNVSGGQGGTSYLTNSYNLAGSNQLSLNSYISFNQTYYTDSQVFVVGGPSYRNDNLSTWSTVSDERLKENINDLEDSALEKILNLKPVSFSWKIKKDRRNTVGFIAQDIEKIMPEFVTKMCLKDQGEIELCNGYEALSIDMDLNPYLVKCIKILYSEIESLKEKINSLNK